MGPLAGEGRLLPNWTVARRLCVYVTVSVFGEGIIDRWSFYAILCLEEIVIHLGCEKYLGCVLLNLVIP